MLKIKENGRTLSGVFWGRENFPEVEPSSYNGKTNLSNMECFAMRYIAMEFIVETIKEYHGNSFINRETVEYNSCFQNGKLYLNNFKGYTVNGYLISSVALTEEGRFILECYKLDEETGEESEEEIHILLS